MNCDLEFVGNKIKERRKEKGISQGQLADMAGVSLPYISDIENGKKNISISILMSIAEVLEVTPNYLLGVSPTGSATLFDEIEPVFSNCTDAEKQTLLQILRDAKSLIK